MSETDLLGEFLVIARENLNLLTLPGYFHRTPFGDPVIVADAAFTVTLYDPAGVVVPGVDGIALTPAGNGNYYCILPTISSTDFLPPAGAGYTLVCANPADGYKRAMRARVIDRKGLGQPPPPV
jgi:hypothetical protein